MNEVQTYGVDSEHKFVTEIEHLKFLFNEILANRVSKGHPLQNKLKVTCKG